MGSQSPPQFYCTMIMIVKRDEATFPDKAGQLQYYSESWISDGRLGLASDEIFTVTIIWSILDPSLKYKAQPRKKEMEMEKGSSESEQDSTILYIYPTQDI